MDHKVKFIEVEGKNPHEIFCDNHVQSPLGKKNNYVDKNEIGLTSYLQILPSVALYGFKYVLDLDGLISKGGDFRVFAARELGLIIPTIQRKDHFYFKSIWLRRAAKIIRLVTRKRYLLRKKWLNPANVYASRNIVQVCKWQKNIL
jgi:hypothetical protein